MAPHQQLGTIPTSPSLHTPAVKLFGAERLELGAYGAAIDAFQGHEYLQLACISLLNIAQSALVFVGLALGAFCVGAVQGMQGLQAVCLCCCWAAGGPAVWMVGTL